MGGLWVSGEIWWVTKKRYGHIDIGQIARSLGQEVLDYFLTFWMLLIEQFGVKLNAV